MGGEKSASRPGRHTFGGTAPVYPLRRRLGGLQQRSVRLLAPTGYRTTIPRSSSCWPVHYTDCTALYTELQIERLTADSSKKTLDRHFDLENVGQFPYIGANLAQKPQT